MAEAVAIVDAIIQVETGGTGNCKLKGGSGENGCLQYMPSTWAYHSTEVMGEVVPLTDGNERYVATQVISWWLAEGLTPEEASLKWNSGGLTHRKGTNKHGIAYDTYAYVEKFSSYYR